MLIYVIILIFEFFCTDYVIALNNNIRNSVFIILMMMLIFGYLFNKNKYSKEEMQQAFSMIKPFCVLYFVMMFYSIIVHLYYNNSSLIMSTIITCIMSIIALLTAMFGYLNFKEKNLKYVTIAVLVNYLITFLVFFYNNGLSGVLNFKYLNANFIDHGLEAHEVMFSMGVILLYLLSSLKNKIKKQNFLAILFLIVFSYFGLKRIIFIAICVCILLNFSQKFFDNKTRYINVIRRVGIIFIIVYLLSSSIFLDYTSNILNMIGINSMGRLRLYSYFQDIFSISPFYLGRGIRFTEFYLQNDSYLRYFGAIHNDILRLYIENGMCIFIYFIYVYFYKFIKRINNYRIDDKYTLQVLIIILFMFLCCATDNLTTYYRFIFVFFSLLLHVIYKGISEREGELLYDAKDKK